MTKQTVEFINKLADLLDEYNVALCSERIRDTDCSRVTFIKYNKDSSGLRATERFTNDRCHSTGYEFRCRIDSILRSSKVERL